MTRDELEKTLEKINLKFDKDRAYLERMWNQGLTDGDPLRQRDVIYDLEKTRTEWRQTVRTAFDIIDDLNVEDTEY